MESRTNSEVETTANKVLLLGDTYVGKTAIVKRFVENVFTDDAKATIGCDFFQTDVEVDGKKIKLSIWDTAGQERFRGIANSYYKRVKGIVLVYNITKKNTFTRLEYWKEEIDKNVEGGVVLALVGNKKDLVANREVKKEEAEAMMAKLGCKVYMETSALDEDDTAIKELFQFMAKEVTNGGNFVAPEGGVDLKKGVTGERKDENGQPKEGGCSC